METTTVLTSLLVLTLTGPSLGYPYTRSVASRSSSRGRDQLAGGLGDYLGGYTQPEEPQQQYGYPEFQPNPRYSYATPQRPKINAEALMALLPYLTGGAGDDYAYSYNSYNDDDGTWYDDTAAADEVVEPVVNSEDAALLQYILDHRADRYSLEDLENMEREAEMEDNNEDQLHALMENKHVSKKSVMPMLGSRVPLNSRFLKAGQKEEAFNIPATSVRKPVFARSVTQPEEQSETKPVTSQEPQGRKAASDSTNLVTSHLTNTNSQTAAAPEPTEAATMTPFIKEKYEELQNYLDRERKVRQLRDLKLDLQEEQRKAAPQKRFISEQETLTQQLANLKKTVA